MPAPLPSRRAPIPAAAGIGLRFTHHRAVRDHGAPVPWLEVHPENYMGGGAALAQLAAIRRDSPLSLHGVALSLGSAEGLDPAHLDRWAALIERLEPGLISEHVAWSVTDGAYLADLLPLPMTEEALDVVCRNVDLMQTRLRRPVLVENPSTYLRFVEDTIPEWEFLAAVSARTGCGLLLDVNNIAVSAHNHGLDPLDWFRFLPMDRVGEIHVAGHAEHVLPEGQVLRIDDHGSHVTPQVWALLEIALSFTGPVPVLVEWDTDVPPLPVLAAEAARAEGLIVASVEAARAQAVVAETEEAARAHPPVAEPAEARHVHAA